MKLRPLLASLPRVVPLAWAFYEMRRTSRRIGLLLRALSFVAVIVALAEPRMTLPRIEAGCRGAGRYLRQRIPRRS